MVGQTLGFLGAREKILLKSDSFTGVPMGDGQVEVAKPSNGTHNTACFERDTRSKAKWARARLP